MKVGLFFGSFNPIHIGHLAIANYMVEFTDIDELWFVVSPHNPLKTKSELLSDRLRFDMVCASIQNDHRFNALDIEFSMPLPSYSIDTLNVLSLNFPQHTFAIVMGSDGLVHFDKWKDFQKISDNYQRYIYPRRGTEHLIEFAANAQYVDAPQMDISSTFIRKAIQQKRDIRYFVPEAVWTKVSEFKFDE